MSIEAAQLIGPFIAGERQRAHSSEVFPDIDPATQRHFADVADCDQVDVDEAVRSAEAAQKVWARLAPGDRSDRLLEWGGLLERAEAELSNMDTREMGKPVRDGAGLGRGAYRMTQYWASNVDRLSGQQIPATAGHLSYTVREPVGVCGVIMPWNGPAPSFVARVAPALACGNAVVVKPSDLTPSSAIRMAELAMDAGMPAGLVNVVPGRGQTGAALASHRRVGSISFTGSPATGRAVAHAAADTFKRVVLELGGKSPNVVFADADLDAAVGGSTWGVFANAGQICAAGTRLLVERPIAEEFVARLVKMSRKLLVGDPMDSATHIGPLASEAQYERVTRYVDSATSEGAEVVAGGLTDSAVSRGWYVQPTVLGGVHMGMSVAAEEVFGPVLSVITFESDDEAIDLANSVEYGLSANVWTSNLERMLRFAADVDAGMIWGNTPMLVDPALPFGGFKSSGVNNAYGQAAVDVLTRLKRVSIRYDGLASSPGWSDLDS